LAEPVYERPVIVSRESPFNKPRSTLNDPTLNKK